MTNYRFSNTLPDLQDCYDHIDGDLHSDSELRAHANLVTLCRKIAALFDDEADDALDEAEDHIEELQKENASQAQTILYLTAELAKMRAEMVTGETASETTGQDYAEGCKP